MATKGDRKYVYRVVEGWGELPNREDCGTISAVACDSQDRVYVYTRGKHPLMVFDRQGRFLASWGEEVIQMAHGIYIDQQDRVFCTDRGAHCVYQFDIAELNYQVSIYTLEGELITQWGGRNASDRPGEFVGWPHGIWADSHGDLYVSEVNTAGRIQKFARQG